MNSYRNLQARIPTSTQHTHPLPCAFSSTWWYELVLGSPPGQHKEPRESLSRPLTWKDVQCQIALVEACSQSCLASVKRERAEGVVGSGG
eukprot:superscaffoldBa00000002_g49